MLNLIFYTTVSFLKAELQNIFSNYFLIVILVCAFESLATKYCWTNNPQNQMGVMTSCAMDSFSQFLIISIASLALSLNNHGCVVGFDANYTLFEMSK